MYTYSARLVRVIDADTVSLSTKYLSEGDMSYPAYSENQIELRIDDMTPTVRDVKQAVAELARVLKDYVDKKVLYEIAAGENDPEYSGYREKKELEKAEARLTAIISRVET